jgi:chromosome segregation ATPase
MHKLEQIENFGAFLDFLSNPDEYKKLIEDVRAASKEYKELVEKKRQIDNIDAWRTSESVRLGKLEDAISSREDKHLENVGELSNQIDAHRAKVASDNSLFHERVSELDDREKAVSSLEKEREKVGQLRSEYEEKLANLRAEKDRLKDWAGQIQATAGELS